MRRLRLAPLAFCAIITSRIITSYSAAAPMILSKADPNNARFMHPTRITNPYLPMPPDTAYVYDGVTGGVRTHDVVEITHDTKLIAGIPTVVTVDTVYLSGIIDEKTIDWFAQDATGNVWYFGEYATQYTNGHPTGHAGSWQAGIDGAQAGIVMEAARKVGDTYHQEDAPGVAEDRATVLTLTTSVDVPYNNYAENVLETKEFSPLEPGKIEHKFYAPGVGNIKTIGPAGSGELLFLTDIRDVGCSDD